MIAIYVWTWEGKSQKALTLQKELHQRGVDNGTKSLSGDIQKFGYPILSVSPENIHTNKLIKT